MLIPEKVSGRVVTNRGVHLQPHGYPKGSDDAHPGWMQRADYWVGLLQSMHMSWCVILSESDAVLTSGACEALLDGGIIPIVRFKIKVPRPFMEMEATKQLSKLYAKYDAPLVVQYWNEPFDERERSRQWPPKDMDQAWHIIRDCWNNAAKQIVLAGGDRENTYPGFPDGPCYDRNPFIEIGDPDGYWATGRSVYLPHNYGKGRPLDYPFDAVSRFGTPLSIEEYHRDLDDYWNDIVWNEGGYVLGLMNQQRREWANPNASPLEDDTCWLGWMKTMWYADQAFGFQVEMALTEGGWVPRDRAGGGDHPIDIRWPYTTPKMVAKKTLAAYESNSPFFAICPWILASSHMGAVGWEFDCWVTDAYQPKYGPLLPVVKMLQDNAPGGVPVPTNEERWAEFNRLLDKAIVRAEAWT